jgi:sulfite reductase (ferredoxin)
MSIATTWEFIRKSSRGYCYVGAAVLRGRITAEQMQAAADLADRFAAGELRTTNMQNLLIVNVPRLNAESLAKELDAIGLRVGGSPFYRGTIACSGTEFCKLAITETKSFSRWLVEELEERLPGFDQHLKLHVTGCPNSCGQHWIADIGIDGKKMKVDGQSRRRLLLLPWRCARSASIDGAAGGISLPCDGGSRCDRAIA